MEVFWFIIALLVAGPFILMFFNILRATFDSDYKERMDNIKRLNKLTKHMNGHAATSYIREEDEKLKIEQALRKGAVEGKYKEHNEKLVSDFDRLISEMK